MNAETNILAELADIINLSARVEGINQSPVSKVYCIKRSQPEMPSKMRWHTSLGIVAQGGMQIKLGSDYYKFEKAHYIATPIDLPVTGGVFSASYDKPYLCLRIDFDALTLHEVAVHLEDDLPRDTKNPLRAVFVGTAGDKMIEAAVRLGKLFQTPQDAPALAPLIVKEILYYLLKETDGAAIRQFVRLESKTHKISQAVYQLRNELNVDVDVTALAKAANMSRAAFFKQFKEVTAMSPIQYQKRFRLLEARRLMISENETAEGSAFKVGYNSASQFSREYSRMFGKSPLQDVMKIKENHNSAC
ncbi:MAG: AraC family transcriptional regulator [Pyrinomonadaceae bacterium]|nr:AraC family transcriptional regulator [Pyrinomonadaceae bacterium]